MMRFLLFLLFCLPIAISVAAADDLVIKAADFPGGGDLEITATNSLVLDTQGSIFSKAHGEGFGPPDTIALHYIGDTVKGYYSMPYRSQDNIFRINKENLTARGNPPFPGFEAGATAFLMIGREIPKGSLDMGVFADQWNLNIRVEH